MHAIIYLNAFEMYINIFKYLQLFRKLNNSIELLNKYLKIKNQRL